MLTCGRARSGMHVGHTASAYLSVASTIRPSPSVTCAGRGRACCARHCFRALEQRTRHAVSLHRQWPSSVCYLYCTSNRKARGIPYCAYVHLPRNSSDEHYNVHGALAAAPTIMLDLAHCGSCLGHTLNNSCSVTQLQLRACRCSRERRKAPEKWQIPGKYTQQHRRLVDLHAEGALEGQLCFNVQRPPLT